MATYDVVMLVVVLVFLVLGVWKGLIWALLTAATMSGSYFAALKARGSVGPYLGEGANGTSLALVAVFAGMCIALAVLFGLGRRLISRIGLKHYDRFLGAVLGLLNGAVACLLISLFATMFSSQARELMQQANYSNVYLHQVANTVPSVVPEEAQLTP